MTLVELTASIIASQAASTSMSAEELQKSIILVHATLKSLEAGESLTTDISTPTETPAIAMTVKQAFAKKDKIFCIICGKGFTTLKRHLNVAHNLKPGEYRKQFGIKATQSLAAKNYVESRRQTAIDQNLGAGLEKARATRKANSVSKNAPVPVVKVKSPVPAVKVKAPVPVKSVKAPVPAKVQKAKVSAKKTVTHK